MEKVAITTKMFLVEGGCNACGMINTCTYTLHFKDGLEATIEELDAFHLAIALALKNGFHQQVEAVGIGEDALFLVKDKKKIEMLEDDFKAVLATDGKRLVLPKKACEKEEVFEKANELLANFFDLSPYEFKLIDD